MNLLLVGPEITDRASMRTYGAVWSFYLTRELRRRGIGVRFSGQLRESDDNAAEFYRTIDLTGIDHIFSVGVRYFDRLPNVCGKILMERMNPKGGAVAQIHDGAVLRAPVNFTLTVRDDDQRFPPGHAERERYLASTRYIGWAADPGLCQAHQREDTLRILVDHPLYGEREDSTRQILNDISHFVHHGRWRKHYSDVNVRQILDGHIANVDLFDPQVRPYKRVAIPYVDVCTEYSATSIFMPTHQEGVGLTVLETATAGALIVARRGFIAPDRLATVRHVEYEAIVPWEKVLGEIDVKASRAKAMENSWSRVTDRLVGHLKDFKRSQE